MPVSIRLSANVLKRPDRDAKPALSARLDATRAVDLSHLSLLFRERSTGAVSQSLSLGQIQLSTGGSNLHSSPKLPLEAIADSAQRGERAALSPSIAWDGYVPDVAHHYPVLLRLNEDSPVFRLYDDRVVWRQELTALEVRLQLCAGGAAEIGRAELALRGAMRPRLGSGIARDTKLQLVAVPPIVIDSATPVCLRFQMLPDVVRLLKLEDALLEGELNLFDASKEFLANLQFVITRGGPPAPELLLPADMVNCLEGRVTRIGIAIRNTGGSPVRIESYEWAIFKGSDCLASGENPLPKSEPPPAGTDNVNILRLIPILPFDCAPGRSFAGEIAIDLGKQNQKIPEGVYDLRFRLIHVAADGEKQPLTPSNPTKINVLPFNRPVDGVVCIDFGTTESGAAFFSFADAEVSDDEATLLPKPIALGRVGFNAGRGRVIEESLFAPTVAVASRRDKRTIDWKFGDEAQQQILTHRDQDGELRAYSNLKWRLGKAERVPLPNDTTALIVDIAAKYLGHVIDMFETHPDVCASLAEAFVTKPAVYKDGQTALLLKAFRESKRMRDPTQQDFEVRRFFPPETSDADMKGAGFLISESWPPIYAMVPEVGEQLFGKVFLIALALTKTKVEELQSALETGVDVVTFDIGGGSLDVSLVHMRMDGTTQILQIDERYNSTSTSFCGDNFAALIDGEVETVLATEFSKGMAATFSELNVPLPQDDGEEISEKAVANQQALAAIRRFFRDHDGALSDIVELGLDRFQDQKGNVLDLAELTVQMRAARKELDIDPAIFCPRVTLYKEQGGSFSEKLDPDKVAELLARILLQFETKYRSKIDGIFSAIAARRSAVSSKPILLITGRGGLFPLAFNMVQLSAARMLGEVLQFRALDQSAKWITSVGGAAIGKDNANNTFVNFVPAATARYAAIAGKRVSGPRNERTIFADFTPDTLDAGNPVAVVSIRRLKALLGKRGGAVEIVRRFEDGTKVERVRKAMAKDLPKFDIEADWLAIRLGAQAQLDICVVSGEDVAMALEMALKATEWQ